MQVWAVSRYIFCSLTHGKGPPHGRPFALGAYFPAIAQSHLSLAAKRTQRNPPFSRQSAAGSASDNRQKKQTAPSCASFIRKAALCPAHGTGTISLAVRPQLPLQKHETGS